MSKNVKFLRIPFYEKTKGAGLTNISPLALAAKNSQAALGTAPGGFGISALAKAGPMI